jgi:hypothetical protein
VVDRLAALLTPPPPSRTSFSAAAEPAPRPLATDALVEAIARQKLAAIGRTEAMSIPAVRKAVHVIAGTISTLALIQWRGSNVVPEAERPDWLRQPEAGRALPATLQRTVQDLIWNDKAYWQVTDRYIEPGMRPARFAYVAASRVTPVHDPADVDGTGTFMLDGDLDKGRRLIEFDGSGVGGLRFYGWPMLDLYVQLMAAAGRYADSPLPQVALVNSGADLEPDEITGLLDAWEAARRTRSTAYLNAAVGTQTYGWSAKELQLVEAREHAALEVSRMFGLPAFAVNAGQPSGSITYSNVVDQRRDLLEALRPWMAPIDSRLSLDDVTPRGRSVAFAVDAYIRDDPETRMRTWQTGISSGVITVAEARAAEPLATGDNP